MTTMTGGNGIRIRLRDRTDPTKEQLRRGAVKAANQARALDIAGARLQRDLAAAQAQIGFRALLRRGQLRIKTRLQAIWRAVRRGGR